MQQIGAFFRKVVRNICNMPKGLVFVLALAGLIAAGLVVYSYKGGDVQWITVGKEAVKEKVDFSVIRYEGKIVSSRLIVDGTGKLKMKHRLDEEKIGIAYYKYSDTVRQIESCPSSRYIVAKNGFTHEVITKEVELE